MRVASFASLSGKELTQEVVERLLKDILQEEARNLVTIDQIQRRPGGRPLQCQIRPLVLLGANMNLNFAWFGDAFSIAK